MITLPRDADRALAVGWATVELDRAQRDLAHLLEAGAEFTPAPSCVVLGARCRSARAAATGLWIALLEPETEGRLAATLARRGEDWVATWAVAGGTDTRRRSAARPGPFGLERLEPGSPFTGPHRFLVEAVPSPP